MNDNIYISSRVRIARNINKYSFPNNLNEKESRIIVDVICETLEKEDKLKDKFKLYEMKEMGKNEKQVLKEKHVISADLIRNECGAFLTNANNDMSILLNEEDHVRIQGIFKGLKLNKAFKYVNEIDDLFEKHLEYAFDEKLGYLTTSPTNVGTGLRASLMIHLPALVELNCIGEIFEEAAHIGLIIRGIYGEGSQALGNIYQISNQFTLGISEKEIISSITRISKEIAKREIEAREILRERLGIHLEDRFFRTLAVAKSCRIIDLIESMNLLSDLKLGVDMGYIDCIDSEDIDNLMVCIQPAHQKKMYLSDNSLETDINRATFLREKLNI